MKIRLAHAQLASRASEARPPTLEKPADRALGKKRNMPSCSSTRSHLLDLSQESCSCLLTHVARTAGALLVCRLRALLQVGCGSWPRRSDTALHRRLPEQTACNF